MSMRAEKPLDKVGLGSGNDPTVFQVIALAGYAGIGVIALTGYAGIGTHLRS